MELVFVFNFSYRRTFIADLLFRPYEKNLKPHHCLELRPVVWGYCLEDFKPAVGILLNAKLTSVHCYLMTPDKSLEPSLFPLNKIINNTGFEINANYC